MAEEQQAAAPPPPKSGGVVGMVVNGLGIFAITLVAVVAGGFINAKLHPPQELMLDAEGRLTLKPPPVEAKEGGKAAGKAAGPAVYYAFDPPIVVNFEQDGATRFLQVTVEAMARDAEAIAAVQQNAPLIRNNLMLLMSSLDYAQVMSREGKESLRAKSLAEVNAILERETGGKAALEDLLFTSFVVQ